MLSYAFKIKSGFNGWRAGDAYAYEFARIRLPDNYIFGSAGKVPTPNDPIQEASKPLTCYPKSDGGSLETVRVLGKRPNGWIEIGNTKNEMKDI